MATEYVQSSQEDMFGCGHFDGFAVVSMRSPKLWYREAIHTCMHLQAGTVHINSSIFSIKGRCLAPLSVGAYFSLFHAR